MKSQNISILKWEIFKCLPVKIGITTRNGGYSPKPYTSLNLATYTGDTMKNVEKNRKLLCEHLNCKLENYSYGIQVHGNKIHRVTHLNMGNDPIECDGLITDSAEPLLNIFIADCVPVAVYDRKKLIGGLCHCGWKGTYNRLLPKMISILINKGSKPEDLLIGIGPSIGACCYNISEDLYNKFSPGKDEGYINNNCFYLDLKKINMNQCLKFGILPYNIEIMNICTSCTTEKFYSYRKEGESSGRFSCYLQLTS